MSDPIDTTYDFRRDANGRDPDKYSPTLRRYHQILWSKPLPSGAMFDLDVVTPQTYLHHRSSLGEFWLSSDSVIPTFTGWQSLTRITREFSEEEASSFISLAYTMGAMMIFPAQRVDGKQTINGARGFTRKIADRMDLTLECIRRHYRGELSPLASTLARYEDFFDLFGTFHGYVEFFLLQDLVGPSSSVKFFLPFDDFETSALPQTVVAYRDYRKLSINFISARNERIGTIRPL